MNMSVHLNVFADFKRQRSVALAMAVDATSEQ